MPESFTFYAMIWLAIAILTMIIEAIVPGLVTIWFSLGALIALAAAALHASLPIQIVVFLVFSLGSLLLTRPLAMRFVNKRTVPTNADSIIGKEAIVTQSVDFTKGLGRVIVAGKDWSAKPEMDTDVFKKGEVVEVVRIEGAKVIVKRKKTAEVSGESEK